MNYEHDDESISTSSNLREDLGVFGWILNHHLGKGIRVQYLQVSN
jgi:hypothetical protein